MKFFLLSWNFIELLYIVNACVSPLSYFYHNVNFFFTILRDYLA